MTRGRSGVVLLAGAALAVAIACGDVPTFADGIAYVSPVILPSLAVAAGDVLRDSLGAPAPLSVQAFDQNDKPIAGVIPSYVVSSVPAGVTIDANGNVTALDSVRSVQIVARIGSRIETPVATLEVVAQPDSIYSSTTTIDSLAALTPSTALQVTLSGNRKGTRTPSRSILVRFQITKTFPFSGKVDSTNVFFSDGGNAAFSRSVDTTDARGIASRSVTTIATTSLDSVQVQVTAKSLAGVVLKGSPVTFTIPVKKGK